MEKLIAVLVLSLLLTNIQSSMSLYDSSKPIRRPDEIPFRRLKDISITITPTLECQCPPNKECVVDFKINQDVMEFLNLRGVLKSEDLRKANEDIKGLLQKNIHKENSKEENKIAAILRKRRQTKDECCCPPRNIMMPTFITNQKFNVITNKLRRI